MSFEKLPRWDELPNLELYSDQVLIYINNMLTSKYDEDEKLITATMINNYVKHKHVDKPVKKKYNRQQLARLIAIVFLKDVFALQEISETLELLGRKYGSEKLYNYFIDCLNNEDVEVPEIIFYACSTLNLYHKTRLLKLENEQELAYGENE